MKLYHATRDEKAMDKILKRGFKEVLLLGITLIFLVIPTINLIGEEYTITVGCSSGEWILEYGTVSHLAEAAIKNVPVTSMTGKYHGDFTVNIEGKSAAFNLTALDPNPDFLLLSLDVLCDDLYAGAATGDTWLYLHIQEIKKAK